MSEVVSHSFAQSSWLFAHKCLVCLLAYIGATRHDLHANSVTFELSAREMSVFVLFVWSVWSVWSLFSFMAGGT